MQVCAWVWGTEVWETTNGHILNKYCLFSIATLTTVTKTNLRRKGLVWLMGYSPSSKEVKARTLASKLIILYMDTKFLNAAYQHFIQPRITCISMVLPMWAWPSHIKH